MLLRFSPLRFSGRGCDARPKFASRAPRARRRRASAADDAPALACTAWTFGEPLQRGAATHGGDGCAQHARQHVDTLNMTRRMPPPSRADKIRQTPMWAHAQAPREAFATERRRESATAAEPIGAVEKWLEPTPTRVGKKRRVVLT
jgi:hypothetical protein